MGTHHPDCRPRQEQRCPAVVSARVPEMLDDGREVLVRFDEVWELVDDDDRVPVDEIREERLPLLLHRGDARIGRRGRLDEARELRRRRPLYGLVVDRVVPIRDGLADEFALPDLAAIVDDYEGRPLAFVERLPKWFRDCRAKRYGTPSPPPSTSLRVDPTLIRVWT